MFANHHVAILQSGSFNLKVIKLYQPLKLYWFGAAYYQVSLEGYQTICVGSFSFAKGQQALLKV